VGKGGRERANFVLRAQDKSAPKFVEAWIEEYKERLGAKSTKIKEAREIAKAMRKWPNRKKPD
jgi:hypothetical protein